MGTEFKESMLNPNLMWLDSIHCPAISGLRSLTSFLHKHSRRPPCPLYHLHASFKRRTLICPNRQPGCENSPVVLAWKYKLVYICYVNFSCCVTAKKKKNSFCASCSLLSFKTIVQPRILCPTFSTTCRGSDMVATYMLKSMVPPDILIVQGDTI